MMRIKLSITAVVTLSSVVSAFGLVPSEKTFRPFRIDYVELKDHVAFQSVRSSFVDALTKVGMVSVTNIPLTAAKREEALTRIHECSMESAATMTHTFHDGTVRRTLATHTIPNGGMQSMYHDTTACDDFSKASSNLRKTVADVTEAFARRLHSILHLEDASAPLLTTTNYYQKNDLKTLDHVVEEGEHLEHFNAFQRTLFNTTEETIDFHVDQGLFIAFTPARLISPQGKSYRDGKAGPAVSDGFFIELQDGSRIMVKFDANDDLIFMLGDGVNQIINPRLSKDSLKLRATPHALTMPYHGEDQVRVWYGRMVLPPADAIHPQNGITFDEIRQGLMEGQNDEQLSLGCSSTLTSRKLESTECSGNSIYCWMQCMDPANYGLSEEKCAAAGLELECANPNGQIYVSGMGDYKLSCINATSSADLEASHQMSFCSVMLNGFQFTNGNPNSCVLFLFPFSPVDTRVRYAFAIIGTFLLCVAFELLRAGRERLVAQKTPFAFLKNQPDWIVDIPFKGGSYGVQVCIGYWIMLLVMTYEAWIFIAIVLGLSTGYIVVLRMNRALERHEKAQAAAIDSDSKGRNESGSEDGTLTSATPEDGTLKSSTPCCVHP